MAKETKPIRSIERAFAILNCFEKKESLGVTEISNLTNLHKSTTFNIMQTLVNIGALEQCDKTNKYKLGLELFRLGTLVDSDVRTIAQPYLEKTLMLFSLKWWKAHTQSKPLLRKELNCPPIELLSANPYYPY